MQKIPKRIKVISGTWTPGTTTAAMKADNVLRVLDERPGGKYSYAKGLRVRAVCTVAETAGGAGVSFPVAKQLQMLRSLSFKHDEHDRMSSLSFLDLAQLAQKGQEVYAPDVVATKLPIADISTGAGTVSITLDFTIPLAKGLYKRGAGKRGILTGLVSAASLKKNGAIDLLGTSAINMTGDPLHFWGCTAIAVDVWLEMFYSDYPVEIVFMKESLTESSINTIQADWDGVRRLIKALVTDDADAAMTANLDDGIVTIDSKIVDTGVSSAELIAEATTHRLAATNAYWPAVIPVVTLAQRDVDECPLVESTFKLERFNSGHGGTYHLLTSQAKRTDLNTQVQILKLQKVPQVAIDRYVASVNARTVTEAREEQGLALRVLQSEDAMGVQEYLV